MSISTPNPFEDATPEDFADNNVTSEPLGIIKPIIIVPLDSRSVVVEGKSVAYEPGKNLNNIRAEFDEFMSQKSDDEQKLANLQAEIEAIRVEAATKISALNDQVNILNDAVWDRKKKQREYENSIRVAENLFRQALENEKVREDFLANSVLFDEITAGLSWREFAFPHQISGAKFLAAARRGILADKMGLGKTLTSLMACDMLQAQKILVIVPDDVVGNFVREIQHWAPHRMMVTLGKQTKQYRDFVISNMLSTMDSFMVVLNYSAWRKDKTLLDSLVKLKFDTIIMDEAHSIKTTATSAYKGCHKLVLSDNSCPSCGGNIQQVIFDNKLRDDIYNNSDNPWDLRMFARNHNQYRVCVANYATVPTAIKNDGSMTGCGWNDIVDRAGEVKRKFGEFRSVKNVIPMTGTVILNKPTDIFSLLSLIDPEHFDDKHDFEATYCDKNWENRVVFKPGGLERLTKQLSGKYIGRDRSSAGVVLPKQDIIYHNIDIDPEEYPKQFKVIQDLTRKAMIMLEDGKTMPIFAMIALITRKRQANVWPAGIEIKDPETGIVLFSVGADVKESIKLDQICDANGEGMIDDFTGGGDMTNGERVIVFSQFKTPLAELERRINNAGISVVRYDGDTPEHLREEIQIDFDRKHCDAPGYEKKWQVCLANYKTGGQGLNLNGATQVIILDEEWNPGKRDQAFARVDRMGQTEETNVHVLRLSRTIDTWLANLIDTKEEMIQGFETEQSMQEQMRQALLNDDQI